MRLSNDLRHIENVAHKQTGIDRNIITAGFKNGVCLIMAGDKIIGHARWIDDAQKTIIIYTNTRNYSTNDLSQPKLKN